MLVATINNSSQLGCNPYDLVIPEGFGEGCHRRLMSVVSALLLLEGFMGRTETSRICLVGQLLAYELKGCKIHRIRLGDASGEYRLKLGDKARSNLLRALSLNEIQIGDWVEVSVSRKVKLPKKEKLARTDDALKLKVKLKVRSFKLIKPPKQPKQQLGLRSELNLSAPPDLSESKRARSLSKKASVAAPIKVLVCQKSGCCKRGGKAMYKTLTKAIKQEGLGDRIRVKPTGCLGKCGKGPNIVVNKTRHHHVESKGVAQLLAAYIH